MAKRPWMSEADNATAGAIRSLLRGMPADARNAVLADVAQHADPEAKAEIERIIDTERINGNDRNWRR
jgi:hypothetical protein